MCGLPGPVLTGVGNLALNGIRSLGRPTRGEPLYRLRYPGPVYHTTVLYNAVTVPDYTLLDMTTHDWTWRDMTGHNYTWLDMTERDWTW
jgi:hypothetical protein